MNKILEIILLLVVLLIVYRYASKVGTKKIINEYQEKSVLRGTYNAEYEKELKIYLDKYLAIMSVVTVVIMTSINIFIGLISIFIMLLICPIPKEKNI